MPLLVLVASTPIGTNQLQSALRSSGYVLDCGVVYSSFCFILFIQIKIVNALV